MYFGYNRSCVVVKKIVPLLVMLIWHLPEKQLNRNWELVALSFFLVIDVLINKNRKGAFTYRGSCFFLPQL